MVSIDEYIEMRERPVRLDSELLQAITLNFIEGYVSGFSSRSDEELMFMPEEAGGDMRAYTTLPYN